MKKSMKQLSLIRVDVQEKFTHRINHFLMRLLRQVLRKKIQQIQNNYSQRLTVLVLTVH